MVTLCPFALMLLSLKLQLFFLLNGNPCGTFIENKLFSFYQGFAMLDELHFHLISVYKMDNLFLHPHTFYTVVLWGWSELCVYCTWRLTSASLHDIGTFLVLLKRVYLNFVFFHFYGYLIFGLTNKLQG